MRHLRPSAVSGVRRRWVNASVVDSDSDVDAVAAPERLIVTPHGRLVIALAPLREEDLPRETGGADEQHQADREQDGSPGIHAGYSSNPHAVVDCEP